MKQRRIASVLLSAALYAPLSISSAVAQDLAAAATPSAAHCRNENLCIAAETLYPGMSYTVGRAVLVMQTDGNLVVKDERSRVRWASKTYGNPGAYVSMQADGNLVVYSPSRKVLWASKTYGHPHAYLAIQRDGNVVIYDVNDRPIWHTNTAH